MTVVDSERFIRELEEITDFIAIDSLDKAIEFENELKNRIQIITSNPYVFRQSANFNNENIRDFIYKGYTIPYLIDNEIVLILGIYKSNIWE